MNDVQRLRGKFTGLAAVGAVACVLGYLTSREVFFYAYLQSYMLWLGVSLGCLGIWMVHNMTGGLWGPKPVRTILESAYQLIPLMAILFIPILVGMKIIYPWTHPDAKLYSEIVAKVGWLNQPFFITRVAIYFAVWIGIVIMMRPWRGRHPSELALPELHQLQRRSAAGLLLYAFTISFAGFDWMMSIEPRWSSSAFGLLVLIGEVLTSFCFLVIITQVLAKRKLMVPIDTKVLHDFGNYLLMSVMFWAYISFSQYLIMWSGQLPEEMFWYRERWRNGWQYLALGLLLFHFLVPFLLLLQRRIKKKHAALLALCVYLLVMRVVDNFWNGSLVVPDRGPVVSWTHLVFPFAIGAMWLAGFFGVLGRGPLLLQPAGGVQDRDRRERQH
jgi:hypothetical protein